ncbi:MAG: hypothetical protein AMJ60_00635 [Desulfobacterales bacterium SG8_35]|nr:MAG: hypothetical protein AMJ60_00635 [Desulfobacterales bacterium SG8_35]
MPEKQRRPQKRFSAPVVTLLIIILVGLLYMGWNYLAGNLPWQQPEEEKPPQITWLQKEAEEKETVQPDEEEPATLSLSPGEVQPSHAPQNECLQTADKILLFFEHLDRQNYIREYAVKGSTLDHFRGIINKLIANPPVVVRETDDLFAILNNMAHFFRILGAKDILLIKDVLTHERELIEPTMALFYKWSEIAPDCSDTNLDINLPLAGLYEYAGYFTNTLGGQSYLFRRELYLRILIRYYSTLVIDRANSVDANRYGIDLRYTLDSLISEIQGNGDLVYRKEYLENLIRLQENYQAKYGN